MPVFFREGDKSLAADNSFCRTGVRQLETACFRSINFGVRDDALTGVDRTDPPIEEAITLSEHGRRYHHEQGLTTRRLTIEDVFFLGLLDT